MKLLEGKVAIVTGGTRGIGFATVKKFLENGAKVVLTGSKQETVDKALAELRAENAEYVVEGHCPKLDDSAEVDKLFDEIAAKYGRIDILVNNAGISQEFLLEEYTEENFRKIVDLNLVSVFVCTQAAAKHMKADEKGGVVLNTSSMVSIYGAPRGCGYPTTKFAVNGMTKSLARELGKYKIRVNAVAPGVIKTDIVANLPEKYIAPMVAKIPLGRMGEPEDIANAYLFLASDLASYVTGSVLSVDGASMNG